MLLPGAGGVVFNNFPLIVEKSGQKMPDEINLPRWVIRRYVVAKDKKIDRFETLPEATTHRQKHGGEVRELVFRLSEVRTISQRDRRMGKG